MASCSSTAKFSSAEVKVLDEDGAQPVAPLLSEYEQWRARNIERNNARLRQLGLIGQEEEQLSNDLAWGRQRPPSSSHSLPRNRDAGVDDENKEGVLEKDTRKRSRKATTISLPPPRREGSRKSRRLANQTASGDDDDDDNNNIEECESDNKTLSSTKERRAALVAECREARQRAAIEVAKAGFQMAAKENPTASYEHCLMRVRSMTEKALAARVRKIESSAGKHCVVKMAIFKSCLQDENRWELAKLASDSLERLKALLPPPSCAENYLIRGRS